ncbi:MAG TPA: hypothetical protein VIU65_01160, partial [Pyrinomonadaceae bacterium]
MKRPYRTIVTIIPAIVLGMYAGLAQAQTDVSVKPSSRVKFQSCRLPNIEGELRCGSYPVYENRIAQTGRKIDLKILVLPARTASPAGALFLLAGGPGQAATDNAQFFATTFDAVRERRDIVMIDQRGTGGSNGLQCDLTAGSGMQGFFGDLFPLEAVKRCRRQLEQKANLRFYTTSIAMDDLDEVRAALG